MEETGFEPRKAPVRFLRPFVGGTPPRPVAVAEALLVALIWGSTLLFVKAALLDLGPLTIAGGRYFLAYLMLLPFLPRRRTAGPRPARRWGSLIAIGLSHYVVGNGALYWALRTIPSVTASLLLSAIPLVVLVVGMLWLRELPTRWQVVGVAVALAGSALFFSPGFDAGDPAGIAIAAAGMLGNASFGLLGRKVTREGKEDLLSLTALPLGIGGSVLLLLGLLIEGPPAFSPLAWGLILWMALVNSTVAYLLYNHALRTLAAFEMNVLLNPASLVTALLGWAFLGEPFGAPQVIGMVVVLAGVTLVQLSGRSRPGDPARSEDRFPSGQSP